MAGSDILSSLRGVRRRIRLLSLACGVCMVVAALVALVLGAVALDYLLVLPAGPRLVLLAAVLGLSGHFVWRWVARPASRPVSLRDVAGHIEQTFPVFDDRLRSAVDFLTTDEGVGSARMKQLVIDQTRATLGSVRIGQAVVYRPALVAMLGALTAGLLLAGIVAWSGPVYTSVALSRLFLPLSQSVWPRQVNIDLLANVPARVPVGQSIDLRMRLNKGDRPSLTAVAYYRYGDGPVQRELMTRGPDGAYSLSLDARMSAGHDPSLHIWIKAGDDTRFLPAIQIVPRLALVEVKLVVTPPDYAARPASTIDLAQAQARVVRGSQVRLVAAFNKPLHGQIPVRIVPLNSDQGGKMTVDWQSAGSSASGNFIAMESSRFHIVGTDEDGFESSGLEEYEIVVSPDQNPTVQIERPRGNESRTAEAYVPLLGLVEDDFGVDAVTLVVDRLPAAGHWELALVRDGKAVEGAALTGLDSASGWRRHRVAWQWELGQLKDASLKSGDVLEYHLLVRDNFRLGDQAHPPAASAKQRITIISQQELANRVAGELQESARRLNDLRGMQVRTRQETQALQNDIGSREQLTEPDRAVVERLVNQQSTLAAQTRQTADRLESILKTLEENRSTADEQRQVAKDVGAAMSQVAEVPMKQATTDLGTLRDPSIQRNTEQRTRHLAQAAESQQRAADALAQAVQRMGSVGSLERMIDQLSDLLDRQNKLSEQMRELGQRNLGKSPEQMNPQDRAELEQLVARQRELAQLTDKTIQEMDQLSGKMEKSDPAEASAMKQSAQTGQEQQVAANQSRAADQASQNQQSQAQATQQQAELGLQMMLSHLREAERRKLEQLARKLAEMAEQIQRLVQRQAGHNLDNLSLQGPQAVQAVDAKHLADLTARANRNPAHAPLTPDITQQSAAQEQTERNTRDLARTAMATPDGAEVSAHLTRADGRMERAIVSLRTKDLAGAYDPSQVEALDALVQAARIIDQQKAEAQRKRNAEQRRTIRETYIKARQDQQAINDQAVKIDQSRDAGGELRRADLVRLGQLPAAQNQLADQLAELEKHLDALGSVVFIWSNQDIVRTMKQVGDMLSARQTGASTQAEQTRIIEQLDAMIQALLIEPPEPEKFASGRGGGGGGGESSQAPQLPAESELRLIRSLQTAVNRSTRAVDAQAQKDHDTLDGLAARQDELRGVLDQLLQKSSGGSVKLGPIPDDRDQLPEEASVEDVELGELEHDLLNDEPSADKIGKDVNRVGDRMARSRQRLGIHHDPGKTTQLIQERIVQNLDQLIAMSRKQQQQQQQQSSSASSAQTQQMPRPGDDSHQQGDAQLPNPSQADAMNDPARQAQTRAARDAQKDPSVEIRERMSEWGGITPRQRQAVIEGAGETVIEKYKKLVDDYYRALATQAVEQ